jgi:hypothetical protein
MTAAPKPAPDVTLFLCGPSKCEHDYSQWLDLPDGGTAVCVKCGAKAIEEAAWE